MIRGSAPNHLSRTRLVRCLATIATVVVLFYAVAGCLGSANMFGDHPRWRGMNRGPSDFGLRSETVSFNSTDGIPLKAWWLPASGTPRGAVIIAHGIDHTRQVMLPRAAFLVRGGYDVLAIDLRGHGESGGIIASPGSWRREISSVHFDISVHVEIASPSRYSEFHTAQWLRLSRPQNLRRLLPSLAIALFQAERMSPTTSAATIFTIPGRTSGYEPCSWVRPYQAWPVRQHWRIISAAEYTSAQNCYPSCPLPAAFTYLP
jgi:hypothetical protein